MQPTIIPLNQVDQADETFRITTRTDVDDLMASIAIDGLLIPPLLVNKKRGFTIVSGFRRISACRRLNHTQIPAIVLEPNPGFSACLRIAIASNALQRPLNLIETARCLQKIASCWPQRPQLIEVAQSLGLPANSSMIDKMISLCRLPAAVQQALLDGSLALPSAVELGRLDDNDAIAFASIFNMLKLSLNKQREVIGLVKEISRREDIRLQDVLQDQSIQQILKDDNLDRGRKARELRYLLQRRRYPEISKGQQHFEAHLKNLKLDPGIKLIPPRHFEATTYMLQLSFDDLEQLKKHLIQLEQMLDHPSLAQILARADAQAPNSK